MKLALLSDLHLAMPGRGCPFTHDEDAFAEWLDGLLASFDQVILLGDVFDHDAGTHLMRPRQALRDLRDAWPKLTRRLDHPRLTLLTGNHDDLLRERGVPDHLAITWRGQRMVFLHGHQFRPLHRAWERVKYPIKWAAAWEQRNASGAVGDLLYAINHRVHRSDDLLQSNTSRGAIRLLQRAPLRLVACGHTHAPCHLPVTPHGDYLNTGACAFGRWDWAELDLPRGILQLRSEAPSPP